jgi:hypothetical protein
MEFVPAIRHPHGNNISLDAQIAHAAIAPKTGKHGIECLHAGLRAKSTMVSTTMARKLF